ncbi:Erythrocyte band 7 integral membrane protein, partial [Ophiophagus hannah]
DGNSSSLGFCGWILVIFSFILVVVTAPISIWLCIKIVKEYERAIIFRLGRILKGGAKGPGLFFVLPCTDNIIKVDMRTISFDIPPQEERAGDQESFPDPLRPGRDCSQHAGSLNCHYGVSRCPPAPLPADSHHHCRREEFHHCLPPAHRHAARDYGNEALAKAEREKGFWKNKTIRKIVSLPEMRLVPLNL